MNLSKLLSKKIPTILGLLFLGAGLAGGVFVLGKGTGGFFPKASPETTPKQMKITNVSHDSFTVSFITDSATPGYVKYGTEANKVSTQVGDDRDQLSGTIGQFTTHHITVRGLQPSTSYYFSIGTANKFAYVDGDKPYSVKTAPKIGGAPQALTAYGTVVTNASTPAKDSIVYLTVENGTPLSTLVKSSGSYAVSLALARTADLGSYASLEDTVLVDVLVQGKDQGQVARAKTTVANTQPIPAITMGQTHDFTAGSTGGSGGSGGSGDSSSDAGTKTNITTEDTSAAATSKFSQEQLNPATEVDLSGGSTSGTGGSTGSSANSADSKSTITENAAGEIIFSNPSVDGQTFTTAKPELEGKAPASTSLQITVESDPVYKDTVTTDTSGNWSYTPPADLAEGNHTVTVSYTDGTGATKTEKRTFIVQAKGKSGLPAFTASPSASPKASPTPTPKASSSATTRKTQPSTSSGVPTSGSVEQTFVFLFIGILLVGSGFFLWHKTAYADVREEDQLDGRN